MAGEKGTPKKNKLEDDHWVEEGQKMTVQQLKAWLTEHDVDIPIKCKKRDLVVLYATHRVKQETTWSQKKEMMTPSRKRKQEVFMDASLMDSLKKSAKKRSPSKQTPSMQASDIPSPNILLDDIPAADPTSPNKFQKRKTPEKAKPSQKPPKSKPFGMSNITSSFQLPQFFSPSQNKGNEDIRQKFTISPSHHRNKKKEIGLPIHPVHRSIRKKSLSPKRTQLSFGDAIPGRQYQRQSPTHYSPSPPLKSNIPVPLMSRPSIDLRTSLGSIAQKVALAFFALLISYLFFQTIAWTLSPRVKYCDTGYPSMDDCQACPKFGICYDTHFVSCDAGYEKKRGFCIKSDKAMKLAERMRSAVVRLLRTIRGQFECNEEVDDFDSYKLGEKEIEAWLRKQFDAADPMFPMGLTDVMLTLADHPSIVQSEKVYFAAKPLFSWMCVLTRMSGYFLGTFLVLLVSVFIIKKVTDDRKFAKWVKIVHQECLIKIQNIEPRYTLGYPVPFLKTAVFESLELKPSEVIWNSAYNVLVSDTRVRILTRQVEGIQMECVQWLG